MRRKRGRSFLLACCSGWPSRGEKENAERSSLCKQAWTPAVNRHSKYHVSKSWYCGVRGSREPEQWTNPAADPGWFGNLQHTGERDDGVYIACESITLTRDIPFGLTALLGPVIRRWSGERVARKIG